MVHILVLFGCRCHCHGARASDLRQPCRHQGSVVWSTPVAKEEWRAALEEAAEQRWIEAEGGEPIQDLVGSAV